MIKKILWIGVFLFIVGIAVSAYFGEKIFYTNVKTDLPEKHIYIPLKTSFDEAIKIIEKAEILEDVPSFIWVARLMNYDRSVVPPGKYEIEPGWSNRELILHLRSGNQTPIKLTFNNIRLPEEFAGKVSQYIQADSASILKALLNPGRLKKIGFDTARVLSLFLPNTYEFYWSTDVEGFFDKMKKEYDKFWNEDRKKKAADLNLTPQEVSILASIVQKESIRDEEKPTIAGLYLNRLRKGIYLQADPTVVFASRNFDLKRVLNKHLLIDSPYNTYKYPGLPPGPICMPSIHSIVSVLNAENHDFIFMCAKPGYNSTHAFARSLAEHNRNANIYRQWLEENNIR